ncbi:MAG: glycerophosphodiester phosphodiesterase [Promethearchaeota archaeon]|jgi:glycerophosphoryl diester phosphodiesterase
MKSMIVWGHRGAGFRGVENSMSSFKKAVDMGVDGIKSEAQLTNDKEIVLHFLPFIVFKNNKNFIHDVNLSVVKRVKLENNDSIPTLHEVFEEFGDNIRYNFDIFTVDTGLKIIEVAEEYNLIDNVELTKPVGHTKSADSLFKPIRKKNKEITLICSLYSDKQISENNYRHLTHMKELEVQVINLAHHRFNFDVFTKVKKAGFKFYLWSVLFKYFMRKYLTLEYEGYGIDGIYTNYPDKLIDLRSEIQR